MLVRKCEDPVAAHFPARQCEAIRQMSAREDLDELPVNEFMATLVAN